MRNIFIATIFGIFYWAIYPTLIGRFVIYRSLPFSTVQAAAYIGSGILIQLFFCIPKIKIRLPLPTLTQIAAGCFHVLTLAFLPGGTYMS
jgi:hypothetical protein